MSREGEGRRTRVAVIFGGRSVEHEISIITALQLIRALDTERYDPIPVYIAQSGRWYTGPALLEKAVYLALPGSLSGLTEVVLLPRPGVPGLTPAAPPVRRWWRTDRTGPAVIPVDVYFPALHGSLGEDGCIQGLLEMAGAAYTGCSVGPAALGMDKWSCKRLVREEGIDVLPDAVVHREDARRDLEDARRRVRKTPGLEEGPLFVKPCALGSSVGIRAVRTDAELEAALAQVFRFDLRALVEPLVEEITEINVSVRGRRPALASVVETPLADGRLLSYEEKYMSRGGKKAPTGSEGMAGLARRIDPEELDGKSKDQARSRAVRIYELLGAAGVARIDFILDRSTGRLYFNEINTLPGSLAFYLWTRSDPPLLYTELLHEIIQEALAHRAERLSLEQDFGFRALKG